MHSVLEWSMQMMPEQRRIFYRRFRIMFELKSSVDTGRRVLAVRTGLSPAIIRKECGILAAQGLLANGKGGMRITPQGSQWLTDARKWMPELFKTVQLEEWLRDVLNRWQVSLLPEEAPEGCSYIRAPEFGGMSGQLKQWLQEKDVCFEWAGNYYDAMGKLLFRNKEMPAIVNDIRITADVSSVAGVRYLLQTLEPGRVWMSLEYAGYLWENYQERG